MIVFALFVALFYFSPDNFQEKTAMDQLICGAILLIILVGAIYFWRTYVDPKENRERRAKGYQEQHTYFGGPTYWRPNPDEKDLIKLQNLKVAVIAGAKNTIHGTCQSQICVNTERRINERF